MIIPKSICEGILKHSGKEAPIEACGYLAGKDDRIIKYIPMTNADGRSDHFSFVPQEQLDAYREMEKSGLDAIGVYHSHPSSPARPSAEDIRLAFVPDMVYIIVSLMTPDGEIKAFKIIEGIVTEIPLIIEINEV